MHIKLTSLTWQEVLYNGQRKTSITHPIISKLWQHSSSTVISKSYLSQGPYYQHVFLKTDTWLLMPFDYQTSRIWSTLDLYKNAWITQYEFIVRRTQNTTAIHEALCVYILPVTQWQVVCNFHPVTLGLIITKHGWFTLT